MLNKKILAASIAASLSACVVATSAFAANLDNSSTSVTYASELVGPGATMAVNNSDELDTTVSLGFTIGDGTSKYVRFDLGDATFGPNVALTVDALGLTQVNGIVSSGGAGTNVVIIEIPAVGEDIPADATVTLTADSYTVPTSGNSSIRYRLFETATQAVNATDALDGNDDLKDTGLKTFTTVGTGLTGNVFVPNDVRSLLEDQFKLFEASSGPSTTVANLGFVDLDRINNAPGSMLPNGVLAPATGQQVVASDLITQANENYTLAFDGKFGFGDWTLNTAGDCATTQTADLDESLDPVAVDVTAATLLGSDHYLCVEVDGTEIIEKGSYSASITSADGQSVSLEGDLGEITYDTITIEVPYLTTFANYTQRIILRNTSSTPADFTISFDTETGTTANTTGKLTGGTIPANGVFIAKANEFVTFEGNTRGSATIEVEGLEESIQAAVQTIGNGSTDTVILNANSITSYQAPMQQPN